MPGNHNITALLTAAVAGGGDEPDVIPAVFLRRGVPCPKEVTILPSLPKRLPKLCAICLFFWTATLNYQYIPETFF